MKHKMTKKGAIFLLSALALLLCAVALLIGSAQRDYRQGALQRSAMVTVAPEDGTIAISRTLHQQGVIRWPLLFRWQMRQAQLDGLWQPGHYTVPPGCGYLELSALLSQPLYAPDVTVTIPEGKQLKEIAKILSDNGICHKEEFLTACENGDYDYPFLVDTNREGRHPLEGYLFPDTYRFYPDTPPEQVINRMLARFGEVVYTPENITRAVELGYSFDEIITLASVVESEAATESDRDQIAQVFYNRLENTGSRMLQSCVTVEYALGIHKNIISFADTQYDSPYNTYLYPGLPIGPICCPSLMSVQSALWPADNSYYFFQSDQYGVIWFASTFSEHLRIQDQVQKDWEVVTRIVGE